jgi:hypothetical protein
MRTTPDGPALCLVRKAQNVCDIIDTLCWTLSVVGNIPTQYQISRRQWITSNTAFLWCINDCHKLFQNHRCVHSTGICICAPVWQPVSLLTVSCALRIKLLAHKFCFTNCVTASLSVISRMWWFILSFIPFPIILFWEYCYHVLSSNI